MLPHPRLIVAFTMLAYPLKWHMSHMVMKKGAGISHHDYVQWMMYWLIMAVWTSLEFNFLWGITDYIPFFPEAKMLFFLWLQHPDFQGALYIWYAGFMKKSDKIDAKVTP